MRQPARQGKRDANHGAIEQALVKAGCKVVDLSRLGGGVPDLLVSFKNGARRELALLEVKTAKGKATKHQQQFEAEGWQVYVVHSIDEALRVVGLF